MVMASVAVDDAFYNDLILRAATVDEILSDQFVPLSGEKRDADLAARRLASWCRSAASGDWSLFSQRLARDGLSFEQVLPRLATVRPAASATRPAWINDAVWVEAALQTPQQEDVRIGGLGDAEPCAFEHLYRPLLDAAERRLYAAADAETLAILSDPARACLRRALLMQLSDLSALAIYDLFVKRCSASAPSPNADKRQASGTARYQQFIAGMTAGGFRRLFKATPVLLRLMATMTRQWLETSRELLHRLGSDLPALRAQILAGDGGGQVVRIEGGLSDRHNDGHSVQLVTFADGSRVVYKPKDLRLDLAWYALVERLNRAGAPLDLKAVRALPRQGYGWTEFIAHSGCADREGYSLFFRRAGAWLALFHCFAATDMHQENMIAAGDHPVPIDLEMLLQESRRPKAEDPADQAVDTASQMLANSVMAVGLLPVYGRSPDNTVFAVGGLTAEWKFDAKIKWENINTDTMRPTLVKETGKSNSNLPHIDGRYAKFADHIHDFIEGFEDYAKFLLRQEQAANHEGLLDGFAGLPVRKVIRPTRFYHMLLQRLKNHRTMDDGVLWSIQADFLARLANWETDADPSWNVQRSERTSLLTLNVPYFVTSDSASGQASILTDTESIPGIEVARDRLENLDGREIAWQVEVIRQNTAAIASSAPPVAAELPHTESLPAAVPAREVFRAEADRIAAQLCSYAIRRGPGAAWIGLDWLGDAEVFQLACLGPDLYNGASGISLFLAAHAAASGSSSSAELALAGVAHLRKVLRSRNSARVARSFGVGGAVGLGSIVYALTVMSKCLRDAGLLAEAQQAARLMTDELIAADKQLDVIGGSAGGILGLLRLYRDTQSADVLDRAIKCGEHLLAQPRLGPEGRRSWIGQGFGSQPLNGMSHGAAGFAYALAALAAATNRQEFADAAAECIAFEDANYSSEQANWPDFRRAEQPTWPCRWCHGAPGIGLARIGTIRRGELDAHPLLIDVRNAVEGVQRCKPHRLDTLCCGALGGIELLCEAGSSLGRSDLREFAAQRMLTIVEEAANTGDYAWNSGTRQFNLGLFRGLAGVGYTLLRQINSSLPNVLIWQ
jgi:type 2 lantibiotic biosynthesis protein LanM